MGLGLSDIRAKLAGLLAGLLLLDVGAGAASADPLKTGAQLYLNISGDKLSDKLEPTTTGDPLAQPDSASTSHSKQVDLGSVPLTLSAGDSSDWGAVIGGKGQYVMPLSDSFSLVNHAGFAKTQTLSGGLFGDTSVDAGPGLQYQQGDLAMSLQPDIGVTLQSDALQQIDYGINSSVAKDLTAGLTATSTTGYKIQADADGDSHLANEAAGLSYILPNKVKLGLGYQIEQTLGNGDSFLAGKQGPSLSAQVPVTNNFNLGTTYAYSSSAASLDNGDASDKGRDVAQTLGVTADWNIGADINADVTLKAKLDVTRESDAGTSQQPLQKAGSVGMQMKF